MSITARLEKEKTRGHPIYTLIKQFSHFTHTETINGASVCHIRLTHSIKKTRAVCTAPTFTLVAAALKLYMITKRNLLLLGRQYGVDKSVIDGESADIRQRVGILRFRHEMSVPPDL